MKQQIQHLTTTSLFFTGEGLSATYTALLSWLLSLVPGNFSFLSDAGKNHSGGVKGQQESPDGIPTNNWGFHVIGLQQVWFEEMLKLMVVITPTQDFHSSKLFKKSKVSMFSFTFQKSMFCF